ncbi:MAG: histidine kinase [Flavobacteriales bacterium]|nr:histidine kinase [Flavobacteriales bacterium]
MKEKQRSTLSISTLVHFLSWILAIQLIFDFHGLFYSFQGLFHPEEPFFDEAFLLIPLMLILFYGNSHFLIPKFISRQKVLVYFLILIVSLLAFMAIGYGSYLIFTQAGFYFGMDDVELLDSLLVSWVLTIGVSSSVGLVKLVRENHELRKKAEKEQKRAELKYLSEQVNPHFLFNTLNAIYSLSSEENAPKTTEAILLLSEIMRYPIKEGKHEKVKLSNEITFIQKYIDLQRIRLGNEYPISFRIEGEEKDFDVAPFLFIPIVENAFKYGISKTDFTEVNVVFHFGVDEFSLRVSNSYQDRTTKMSEKFGLLNLRERLELIYPEKHELEIQETQEKFSVSLSIKS